MDRPGRPTIRQRIADFILGPTDKPADWWPFSRLRPKPEDRMTTLFVLKIALAYGLLSGIVMWLLICVLTAGTVIFHGAAGLQPQAVVSALVVCLSMAVGISVVLMAPVYRLTVAALWNRRARALLEMPPQPPPSPLAYENLAVSSDRPEDLP